MEKPLRESIDADSLALVTENGQIKDQIFPFLPSKSIFNSISTSKMTEEQPAVSWHYVTSGTVSFELGFLKPPPKELLWDLSLCVSDHLPCTDGAVQVQVCGSQRCPTETGPELLDVDILTPGLRVKWHKAFILIPPLH